MPVTPASPEISPPASAELRLQLPASRSEILPVSGDLPDGVYRFTVDAGGVYQVVDDLMVFATPPERAIPVTSGIYLLRWSLAGDTLTLAQIDDGRRDADFAVSWVRVGDAPAR